MLAWQAICDTTGCGFEGAKHTGIDAITLANNEARDHMEKSLVVTEGGSRSYHMVTTRSVDAGNVERIEQSGPVERFL